jgi:heptosyltransferase-1
MSKLLLVKMSSMGDIIHTFPALTELHRHRPEVEIDWVVEPAFAELAGLHPAVNKVIDLPFRKIRRQGIGLFKSPEWLAFKKEVGNGQYDRVIDAQSLLKSAWISRQAGSRVHGLDFASAREGLASLFYTQRYRVAKGQLAIERIRQLFGKVYGYTPDHDFPGFGLDRGVVTPFKNDRPYLFFLHGTAWKSKQWPDAYWMELAYLAGQHGFDVLMTGGNMEEMARARLIADRIDHVTVLPRHGILELAAYLVGAELVVGVDTGLSYLASALGNHVVTLHGATRPELSPDMSPRLKALTAEFVCAPCHKRDCFYKGTSDVSPACFSDLPPVRVWNEIELQLAIEENA